MSIDRYASPYWRKVLREQPSWFVNHPRLSYIRQAGLASPPWPDNYAELRKLKALAKVVSEYMGEEYVLDHIVPLNHPEVCGLNVPANIQLIPRRCNAAKSNKWNPHQLELLG